MSDRALPSHPGKLPPLSTTTDGTPSKEGGQRGRKTKAKSAVQRTENNDTNETAVRSRSTSRPRSRSTASKDSFRETPTPTPSRTPRQKASMRKKSPAKDDEDEKTVPSGSETDRPKRRKKQGRTQSKETLLSSENITSVRSSSGGSATKKKRKRKKPGDGTTEAAIGLEAELADLDDDVVVTDTSLNIEDPKWMTPNMRSEPLNKVFIEQKSGFKSTSKARLARMKEQDEQMAEVVERPQTTTLQYALKTQRIFRTISIFLQGLLAGFALWHIITTLVMLNQSDEIFLQQYHTLAEPVQALYYILFAASMVAVYDKYDVGRPTREMVQRAFTLQSGAIACLFYSVGIIISVSIAADDNRIGLYTTDPELWQDPDETKSILNDWKILNTVRGVLAVLAWTVISLRPASDRLIRNLQSADENMLQPEADNQPVQQVQVIRSGVV